MSFKMLKRKQRRRIVRDPVCFACKGVLLPMDRRYGHLVPHKCRECGAVFYVRADREEASDG